MKKKLNLRDKLARERTHFANERTLLAYWRTALAFFVLGAFLIKFLPQKYSMVIAVLSIVFGAGLFVYGTKKFLDYKRRINKE